MKTIHIDIIIGWQLYYNKTQTILSYDHVLVYNVEGWGGGLSQRDGTDLLVWSIIIYISMISHKSTSNLSTDEHVNWSSTKWIF